jgi:hypothetical protein
MPLMAGFLQQQQAAAMHLHLAREKLREKKLAPSGTNYLFIDLIKLQLQFQLQFQIQFQLQFQIHILYSSYFFFIFI